MLQATQEFAIAAGLGQVWNYVSDMRRWASIMPGYQDCSVIDSDNSLWFLKIGVGGLHRAVKVRVHVERWGGPHTAEFAFRLEGDPVEGRGRYSAVSNDAGQTWVTLQISVSGSGPMAPMWEAMGAPVLPKFLAVFAKELKERIEAVERPGNHPGPKFDVAPKKSLWQRVLAFLSEWKRRGAS